MVSLVEKIDKTTVISIGEGAIYSLVAIIMVLAIIAIIIGAAYGVTKLVNLIFKAKPVVVEEKKVVSSEPHEVVIKDDDMMAAVLVATIDYKNEVKGDVRVVNVREI